MSNFKELTDEDRAIWTGIQERAWANGAPTTLGGMLRHYWDSDRADFGWAVMVLEEHGSIAETVRDWEEHILTMDLDDAAWDLIHDEILGENL